jgi:hypothetical protein
MTEHSDSSGAFEHLAEDAALVRQYGPIVHLLDWSMCAASGCWPSRRVPSIEED